MCLENAKIHWLWLIFVLFEIDNLEYIDSVQFSSTFILFNKFVCSMENRQFSHSLKSEQFPMTPRKSWCNCSLALSLSPFFSPFNGNDMLKFVKTHRSNVQMVGISCHESA